MKAAIELEVLNELGIHARPATEFVRYALQFKQTAIRFTKDGQSFAATSILEVLSAELDHGARFTLEADGPDAETIVREFGAMMVRFRDEEPAGAGKDEG